MFGSKLKADIEAMAAERDTLAKELEETKTALHMQSENACEWSDKLAQAETACASAQKVADDLTSQVEALIAERDALAAKLAEAETKLSKLAAKPSAFADVVDGAPAPVAEGVVDGVAETWEEALKAEGSYAAAREKHPAAFAARFPNVKI